MSILVEETSIVRLYLEKIYPGRYINKIYVRLVGNEGLRVIGPAYIQYVGKYIKRGTKVPVNMLVDWAARTFNTSFKESINIGWAVKTNIFNRGSKLPKSPYSTANGLWADKRDEISEKILDTYIDRTFNTNEFLK